MHLSPEKSVQNELIEILIVGNFKKYDYFIIGIKLNHNYKFYTIIKRIHSFNLNLIRN